MHRSALFALGLLLASTVSGGQATPSDSQTLQALLAEMRQLRKDLQTTTVASQRVQILLYRAQLQETAVAGAQRRLDDVHSKLAEVRSGVRHFTSEIERAESALNESQNAVDRKQLEDMLTAAKRELESQLATEQEWETKEAQAVQDLRSEQAKLSALQEQLEQLDRSLEQSIRPPAAAPRE
jgi:chromosome segregation ATPase